MRTALAVLVLVLLTGCGVPRDDTPRALNPANAPAGALPTPSTVPEPVGEERVALYFAQDGRVVPVTRPVPRTTSVEALLELLFAGPTEAEQAAGASSLIPASVMVENVQQQGDTAVVTLGGSQDQPRLERLAFAQIVATLAPERVSGVRFRLDGADLPVPRADGSLSDAPVSRADYAELIAA